MATNFATNILVPTDYGPAAERAADVAADLALTCNASLTLLHVVVATFTPYAPSLGGIVPGALAMDQVLADARHVLDREAKRVRKRCPDVKTLMTVGYPWRSIVEAVDEHGFDLIVIGTHGRRGAERFLIGSVAEKVVRASPVPVLTVHAFDG